MNREDFWESDPALRKVRDAAGARGIGRWALLASCLARVSTQVPIDTVLPAIVGSYASLNYFVAIAAGSSGGKSAAQSVARELLPIPDTPRLPLGTGQGLVAAFVQYVGAKPGNKSEDIPPVPAHLERTESSAVLFAVDEIGDIVAKVGSGGNNLMPVLRSAWGAEAQGSSTVTKENKLRLAEHTYRMGLIINTQLGAARFLLNDSDVGTPQRFLFVPAIDDDRGLTEDDIDAMTLDDLRPSDDAITPIALGVEPDYIEPTDLASPGRFHTVRVCDTARLEVVKDRARAMAGFPAHFPPHHLLNRLKTASLLHFLCGGNGDVTEAYWELAGVLMTVSEETKKMLQDHADEAEAEEDVKKGEKIARVEDAKQDKLREVEDRKVTNARQRILDKLSDGPLTLRDIQQGFNSRTRKVAMTALQALVTDGRIAYTDETYLLAE